MPLSPCARGCCWTPMDGVCARSSRCGCHWGDWLITAAQTTNNGPVTAYRDPTSNEAIYNIEKERRGR